MKHISFLTRAALLFAPDPVASVIRVDLDGPLAVDNRLPSPAADGTIRLPLWMVDIHNSGYGAEVRLGEDAGTPAIVNWADKNAYLAWSFETATELTLRPVAAGWQPVILRSVELRPVTSSQP